MQNLNFFNKFSISLLLLLVIPNIASAKKYTIPESAGYKNYAVVNDDGIANNGIFFKKGEECYINPGKQLLEIAKNDEYTDVVYISKVKVYANQCPNGTFLSIKTEYLKQMEKDYQDQLLSIKTSAGANGTSL